jgi:dsRNA-specific ribonuclease
MLVSTPLPCCTTSDTNQGGKVWKSISHQVLTDENLIDVYHKYGLHRCAHYEKAQIHMSNHLARIKAKATMVEAILGAVHLDGGDVALHSAMEKLSLLDHSELRVYKAIKETTDKDLSYPLKNLKDVKRGLCGSSPGQSTILNNYAWRICAEDAANRAKARYIQSIRANKANKFD